jgi:acetylornithine deacetylase/succinyl-diaminopimelate desuccinylase-like protein
MPGAVDNSIMLMNRVVDRLGNHRARIVLAPTAKQFVTAVSKENKTAEKALTRLLQDPANADDALDHLAKMDKVLAEQIRAMIRMTVTPTMIHGGVKENIIPSECEAVFDCRVLPGQDPAEALSMFRTMLEDFGLEKLEFETIQANEPSESSANTGLYQQIVDVLKVFDPGCSTVPTMLTGGTDSRFFRRMGSVCYGFQPMRADMPYGEILKMIHGIDERISVANLVFGASVLYNVVERFMT